ncbi:MAG: hypothetical protein MK161_05965 [Pirellulales bacterium]|jgi:hypothetical protein|nr:hypothetical protein [Pirellulales bacterium]
MPYGRVLRNPVLPIDGLQVFVDFRKFNRSLVIEPARHEELVIMAREHSKYQQRIIKNYYQNRGAISLQRLSELVTELYLSEGKKREQQWEYIEGALQKLEIPTPRIEHLRQQDDPKLLANLVEELMAKQ